MAFGPTLVLLAALCAPDAPRAPARSMSRLSAVAPTPPALDWRPEGHTFWRWDAPDLLPHAAQVHYIAAGPEDAPPLILVHGFGASWYHFRYNVPTLSRRLRVYAVDLLGFGLSDKPLIEYTSDLWAAQLSSFMRDVVAPSAPCQAAIVGNSLGGFASLATAVASPDLVQGVALLNAAGRFDEETPQAQSFIDKAEEPIQNWADAVKEFLQDTVQRLVLYASFQITKQPARIRQVLEQVYSCDRSNVDDDLVDSIVRPALSPTAPEVFYRIVSRNAVRPSTTVNRLLNRLDPKVDVLLLWGEDDPWIRPAAADRIQRLRPGTRRISVDAGHCPHDEAPAVVNKELERWALNLAGVGDAAEASKLAMGELAGE